MHYRRVGMNTICALSLHQQETFLGIDELHHNLRLLAGAEINQPRRGTDTRRFRFLIDAQENRSIGRKLDIRTFSDKSSVDLHGSPIVAEAGGRGCRCLCRASAKQSETFITISRP